MLSKFFKPKYFSQIRFYSTEETDNLYEDRLAILKRSWNLNHAEKLDMYKSNQATGLLLPRDDKPPTPRSCFTDRSYR